MEHILDETVPNEDLKKFEQKYHEELNHGKVSQEFVEIIDTERCTDKLLKLLSFYYVLGECHLPV